MESSADAEGNKVVVVSPATTAEVADCATPMEIDDDAKQNSKLGPKQAATPDHASVKVDGTTDRPPLSSSQAGTVVDASQSVIVAEPLQKQSEKTPASQTERKTPASTDARNGEEANRHVDDSKVPTIETLAATSSENASATLEVSLTSTKNETPIATVDRGTNVQSAIKTTDTASSKASAESSSIPVAPPVQPLSGSNVASAATSSDAGKVHSSIPTATTSTTGPRGQPAVAFATKTSSGKVISLTAGKKAKRKAASIEAASTLNDGGKSLSTSTGGAGNSSANAMVDVKIATDIVDPGVVRAVQNVQVMLQTCKFFGSLYCFFGTYCVTHVFRLHLNDILISCHLCIPN